MAKIGSRKWWGHYREQWLNFLEDSSLFLSFFFEFPSYFFFVLENNCFTIFSHTKMLISYNNIYIYISFPLWASLPLPVPPFPLQVVTERQAGLPVLYSSFPLASYFTHDIVCVSMLPTFSICPTISWPCCVQKFIPTSASPFFPFR